MDEASDSPRAGGFTERPWGAPRSPGCRRLAATWPWFPPCAPWAADRAPVRLSRGSNACARSASAAATRRVPRGHPQAPSPSPRRPRSASRPLTVLCSSGMVCGQRRPARPTLPGCWTQREVPGRLCHPRLSDARSLFCGAKVPCARNRLQTVFF